MLSKYPDRSASTTSVCPDPEQPFALTNGVQGTASRAVGVLLRLQVGLEDRLQDQHGGRLHHTILDAGMPNGRCLPSGFRDVHTPDRLGLIRALPEFFRQFVQPPVPSRTPRCPRTSGRPPRAAAVVQAAAHRQMPGRLFGTPCRTGRRTGSRASSSLWCATPSATSQPLLEVLGSSPISRLSATSCVDLELEAPSLRRSYPASTVLRASPPPDPAQPVPHGRPVEEFSAPRRSGFPCCVDLPVPTCRRHYPGGPLGSDRSWNGVFQPFPFIPSGGGLPRPCCRVGVHIGRFEACSTFTRVTACLLAASPSDPLSRRLRRLCYLRRRSDSYRLERPSCRVGIAPTEDQHLSTAHNKT